MKIRFLSLTIMLGFSCNSWIVSMNVAIIALTLKILERKKKMGIVCKIIHHHHVEFFPSNFGRPMIRSVETSSQLWICMANGSRWPRVLIVSPLLCWQTKHSTTKFEHQFSYLDVSMWVPIQSQRIHHLFMSCYPYLLMKCCPYPLIRFQCERNSIIWDVYIHALYVCIFRRISIENHLYIFHHCVVSLNINMA